MLSAEEFFEPPAVGDLRGHSFKVRQPPCRLARRKAAFTVRSAGPWHRLPPHNRRSSYSAQFQGPPGCQLVLHLDPDIVLPYPIHCFNLNGLGAQVLFFRPVNLIWFEQCALIIISRFIRCGKYCKRKCNLSLPYLNANPVHIHAIT